MNPCRNGGTCRAIYEKGEYKCECTADYTGADCEAKGEYINLGEYLVSPN